MSYFGGFQIVAVSFIPEFSFQFCCIVFDVKQLWKNKLVLYYVMTKCVQMNNSLQNSIVIVRYFNETIGMWIFT